MPIPAWAVRLRLPQHRYSPAIRSRLLLVTRPSPSISVPPSPPLYCRKRSPGRCNSQTSPRVKPGVSWWVARPMSVPVLMISGKGTPPAHGALCESLESPSTISQPESLPCPNRVFSRWVVLARSCWLDLEGSAKPSGSPSRSFDFKARQCRAFLFLNTEDCPQRLINARNAPTPPPNKQMIQAWLWFD